MPSAPRNSEPQFTELAIHDLDEIEEYISRDNPSAARRVIERIRDACFTIADQPYMGRVRPDLAPNVRSFVVGNYIVLYRISEDGVEIVRFSQGSRNLRRLLE